MEKRVNIRPGVSVLSVFPHLNYTYWHALAEFVDNALQSYLQHRDLLSQVDPYASPLRVDIKLDAQDGGTLTIFDYAAGIPRAEFARAFKPAAIPPDRSGLSEFGMGMKSAACWCARTWSVRTKPLNDLAEYLIRFNVEDIVSNQQEELEVLEWNTDNPLTHYTEVRLEGLHKVPVGKTIHKIKQHLADIYRDFIRRGELALNFDGETLQYTEPPILVAPFYKDEAGSPREWRKEIELDLGRGLKAIGFAAIRETASTSRAGFALFRRGRVIQGSGDTGYRPEIIFGKSNSFIYQRVFGELHLEGFEVTHTKDGFKWDDNEETFLQLLKEDLSQDSMPLLQQAKWHRVNERPDALRQGAETATNNVAEALEKNAPPVIAHLREDQSLAQIPSKLPSTRTLARREIELRFLNWNWVVSVEHTEDPAAEWLEISDAPTKPDHNFVRHLGLRMSLAHPFMQRFAGSDPDAIEPLLRIAVALGLGEIIARESAAPKAFGRVRQNLNEILRQALSKP